MTKLDDRKHTVTSTYVDDTQRGARIKPTSRSKEREVAFGLRTPKVADQRDSAWPMRMALGDVREVEEVRTQRPWYDNAIWIDQGNLPACVGAALTHIIEDSAMTRPESPVGSSIVDYRELYHLAQERDEWPGTDYDGTSARGGCRALRELGLISSYLWAENMADIIDALLYHGPVAVGTKWTEEMFAPRYLKDAQGTARWTLVDEGQAAGYHEYVLNGINVPARIVRMKNSWGQWWGTDGRAAISFDTLERLVFSDGDAVIVQESRAA